MSKRAYNTIGRLKKTQPFAGKSPKERPAEFALLTERPMTCARCGSSLAQEPFASRCMMCGQIYYLIGVDGVQTKFERSSGLSCSS